MMMYTEEQFAEAETDWDLERLYTDLAAAKGKQLTLVEKLHLRGLLCGYSPAEIANQCQKSARGLNVDLCNTLYQYVKTLIGRNNERMNSWHNVRQWLGEAGYQTELATESQFDASVLLNALVNVTNLKVEKNEDEILIDINFRVALKVD